jgi:SOS response regulatory protein OraA/RecX
MGRARLEAELLAKGFDTETTARTLREVYPGDRETELAEALLSRGEGRGRKTKARQAALLRRAGFQEETIESLIGVEWSW